MFTDTWPPEHSNASLSAGQWHLIPIHRASLWPLTAPWRSRKNNPSIGHLNLSQQIWCWSSVVELLVRWALSSPPQTWSVSFRSQTPHYIMLQKMTFILFDIFGSALSVKSFCVFWIPIHLKSLQARHSKTLFHACGTITFTFFFFIEDFSQVDGVIRYESILIAASLSLR